MRCYGWHCVGAHNTNKSKVVVAVLYSNELWIYDINNVEKAKWFNFFNLTIIFRKVIFHSSKNYILYHKI